MGRRNRDAQQARRRVASDYAARSSRPVRFGETGATRWLVDFVGILVIAVLVSLALREVGMANVLLRIVLALVVGRVVVSFARRRLDAAR